MRKDRDGSYDVLGTRDGAEVMLEVSADLTSVTERAGRGHAFNDDDDDVAGTT